ncbi:MAG: hypothetical protein AB1489_28925 [Acidobacteriota bacterium]
MKARIFVSMLLCLLVWATTNNNSTYAQVRVISGGDHSIVRALNLSKEQITLTPAEIRSFFWKGVNGMNVDTSEFKSMDTTVDQTSRLDSDLDNEIEPTSQHDMHQQGVKRTDQDSEMQNEDLNQQNKRADIKDQPTTVRKDFTLEKEPTGQLPQRTVTTKRERLSKD